MPSVDNTRAVLEVGGVPNLPTRQDINTLVAKIKPSTLQRAQTQLKETWRRQREQPTRLIRSEEMSTSEEVNRTRILEMELLKLKGEFKRNKTSTKNMIKKLSTEREMVNESIKELSLSRKEEQGLVNAIRKDNVELLQQKQILELDLIAQTERLEQLLGTLSEAKKYLRDKDERLQRLELEKFEKTKKVEALELKLKVTQFETQQPMLTTKVKAPLDWSNPPMLVKVLVLLVLFFGMFVCLFNKQPSVGSGLMVEPFCKECDYERDIYRRIQT